MQRKNNILMPFKSTTRRSYIKGRNAMAMIMAIAVLVIMATIMALSLSLAVQTTKKTTDTYLYEQSALLAHSAAEYAMLKISQVNPCEQDDFSFSHDIYDINISMRYVYTFPSPCNTAAGTAYFDISYPDSNGTVLMDITVSTDEGTEPIRYFRRSIQKL